MKPVILNGKMLDWTRGFGDKGSPMLHRIICLILLTFLCVPALAARVVFIELHKDGKPVELEPRGSFFHVAIRYKGMWLQAHSQGGVTLVDDIRPYGDVFLVLENKDYPEPSDEFVKQWLGKPFDFGYTWDSPHSNYCSRLVAQVLGVPPQRMSFASAIWKDHYRKPLGKPGLSPDKLFHELLQRGFKAIPCQHELEVNESAASVH